MSVETVSPGGGSHANGDFRELKSFADPRKVTQIFVLVVRPVPRARRTAKKS